MVCTKYGLFDITVPVVFVVVHISISLCALGSLHVS